MRVTTRIATDSDLPFLCESDTHVSPGVQAELVSLGRVMVTELDGVVVGLLRWGMLWDEIPFMNLLWIAPHQRGRGVGSLLIEAWEHSQAAVGHSVVLTSTVSDERAQHLYRRLGYVDSGVLLLPHQAAELLLRKSLSTSPLTPPSGRSAMS